MPSPPDSPRTSPRLVGRAVERVEDAALLTARGRFADDMGERPGTAHAAVLRSPHAHAEIVSLDTTAALSMPAVVTVLTGEDVAAWSRPFIAGVKQPMRHFALAVDRVRYAGEPVAVVVARDRYGAEDALERIEVEYRELAPVVDPVAAAAPGAPLLHRDVGSNVVSARRLRYGDPDAAFASAAHRVAISVRYPRNACTPIEGFVVVAEHLGEDGYERGQVRQVGLHRHRNGGGIEVTAELKSNGTRVQRTGTSNGNGSLPLGAQIEIASEAAFRSCAAQMLAVANRGWRHGTDVWNGRRPAPTCRHGQRARQQARTDDCNTLPAARIDGLFFLSFGTRGTSASIELREEAAPGRASASPPAWSHGPSGRIPGVRSGCRRHGTGSRDSRSLSEG